MHLRPWSCAGVRRLPSSGVNRVQPVSQTGELVPDTFLLPTLHFHRAGKFLMLWVAEAITLERQHRHGDRSFRMLFCISMHRVNTFVEASKLSCSKLRNIKHIYSQTAESPRKAAGADAIYISCLSAFVYLKISLKSQRCRSLLQI